LNSQLKLFDFAAQGLANVQTYQVQVERERWEEEKQAQDNYLFHDILWIIMV